MMKFAITYWKTLLCSLCILILSIAPFSSHRIHPMPNTDKLIHFMMYLIFTVIFFYEYRKTHPIKQLRFYLMVMTLPIIYGGLMELFQSIFTTNRSADVFDFLANSVGVFVGVTISYTFYYVRR